MKLRDGLLVILGVLVLIAGASVLFDEPEGSLRTVPTDLRGVWVTANLDYGDRYLELGADFITFGTGGVNARRFKVTGFDRTRDVKGKEIDTVYFQDVDGSSFSRQFSVGPGRGDELVFLNQPQVVWVHE
jgi:hypothetical protein